MIYVCSLYSNGMNDCPIPYILLERRVKYTMSRVHNFLKEGKFPYSPILHTHEMSKTYELPKEYSFWQKIDRNAIDHCSEVYVLMMKDGYGNWEKSVGITDEISYAKKIGKKITYIECTKYNKEYENS